MQAFDIAQIDLEAEAESGAKLHLKNPRDGAPIYADGDKKKPCRLHLLGIESATCREKQAEIRRRRERREEAEQRKSTDDERAWDDAELLSACTTGWENLAFKGKGAFSQELAKKMYYHRPWTRNQALTFMLNLENFTRDQEAT